MKRPAAQAYMCTSLWYGPRVDCVALAKTKGLLPCVQQQTQKQSHLERAACRATPALVPQPLTPWAPTCLETGNCTTWGAGWGQAKEPASQFASVCQNYPLANYPLVSPDWFLSGRFIKDKHINILTHFGDCPRTGWGVRIFLCVFGGGGENA